VRAVDKKVELGRILGRGLAHALPLLGVSILVGLTVIGGMVLLIVPGIIWALGTCVAVPAYVGQPGLGIGGAVQRSFELTRNNRWMLLVIFIVALVVESAISGTCTAVMGRFGTVPFIVPQIGSLTPDLFVALFQIILSSLLSLVGHVFIVAIYVCLRESKEKASPSQTAAVFE